jgi:hypothetical protein
MSRSSSSGLSTRRPRRLVARLIVVVMAVFGTSALASAAVAATPQNNGVYYIQFKHSGKCLNKPDLWTDDGWHVEQYDCLDWAATERWRLELVGDNRRDASGRPLYLIRNMQSGKCLNIWLASRDDGAEVVQYTCGQWWTGWTNEWFSLIQDSSDPRYYKIKNVNSGKCLNVQGARTDNTAPIIQYECDGYWPQGVDNMRVFFLQAP